MGRSQRHRLESPQRVSGLGFVNPLLKPTTVGSFGQVRGTGPNLVDQKTTDVVGANYTVVSAAGPTALTPNSGTIANVGAAGRNVGSVMSPTGGTSPYTYQITNNPSNCGLTFVGNQMQSTTNPIAATTGAKTLGITVFDANSKAFTITYTLTLT